MSRAATQRTVKFISKMGTYTCYLQSSSGRVFQMYDDAGIVTPQIDEEHPVIIYFVCISSLQSGLGQASAGINGHPTWYIGGNRLNEGGQKINESGWREYFELISPSDDENHPYYGIKFIKNLAEHAGYSSFTLKAVGEVSIVGTDATDNIQAITTVDILKVSASGITVYIIDNTNLSFTFTEEGQNMEIKANTYKGSALMDETPEQSQNNDISYQWQRISEGMWKDILDKTSQSLIINENDVMTYAQYRCKVSYNGGEYYGNANIQDATDPYIINANPRHYTASEDDTNVTAGTAGLEELQNIGDKVVYRPFLALRDGKNTKAPDNYTFNFALMDSAGANIVSPILNAAECRVLYDYGMNHGNIAVNIETFQTLLDYDKQ